MSKPKTVKKVVKKKQYLFPVEQELTFNEEYYFNCPPNSKYWVHGEQKDDSLDDNCKRRIKIITDLKKIKIPEQRTPEWFKQRNGMITASDGGTTIGVNKYESQYNVILKKLIDVPFKGAESCYHGKKYESIATMIYQYRMNVTVHEYGCIEHPVYKFLGASPDGIIDEYKLDNIHKTNLVGRMLEIKVPKSREINMTSYEILDVCPIYYHAQVQLQLECCDLEECDFWQCEINEYPTREAFIEDTNPDEPFRSKETGFEKGVLIQLIPMFTNGCNIMDAVYNNSKFLYPSKIEMTPYECDKWISETISNLRYNELYKKYIVDRVIYWKLIKSRCLTIKRDKKWFAKYLPIFKQTWGYISFFRENEKQKNLLLEYITYAERKFKKSDAVKHVMEIIKILYETDSPTYKNDLVAIKNAVSRKEKCPFDDEEEQDDDGFGDFNVCK